jgi:hypothetical protein
MHSAKFGWRFVKNPKCSVFDASSAPESGGSLEPEGGIVESPDTA